MCRAQTRLPSLVPPLSSPSSLPSLAAPNARRLSGISSCPLCSGGGGGDRERRQKKREMEEQLWKIRKKCRQRQQTHLYNLTAALNLNIIINITYWNLGRMITQNYLTLHSEIVDYFYVVTWFFFFDDCCTDCVPQMPATQISGRITLGSGFCRGELKAKAAADAS